MQPARVRAGLERLREPRVEAGLLERRGLAEGLRQAAMRAEQVVELAGEPGAERVDHAVAKPQPLRVCAGHAQQPVGQPGAQGLRLLATQHVGLAGAQAADDRQRTPERGRHLDQPVADRVDPGRQVDIRRLDPGAAGADHPAGQQRRAGMCCGPVADRLGEHRVEARGRQPDRAMITGATIADRAVAVDQPGAQPR